MISRTPEEIDREVRERNYYREQTAKRVFHEERERVAKKRRRVRDVSSPAHRRARLMQISEDVQKAMVYGAAFATAIDSQLSLNG